MHKSGGTCVNVTEQVIYPKEDKDHRPYNNSVKNSDT